MKKEKLQQTPQKKNCKKRQHMEAKQYATK